MSRKLNQSLKIANKKPWLAFLLCVVFPGLGQYYNNTFDQKRIGLMYISVLFASMAIMTYFYVRTESKSDSEFLLNSLSQSIGYGLSLASGFDAYQNAKIINVEFIKQNP